MRRKASITLLSVGHACVDVYQGAVASLIPFLVAERGYGYAAAAGVVLAASLLSSVAQPLFGALTDRRPVPFLLPAATLLAGLGIALSATGGSYALTLVCVAVSGAGSGRVPPRVRPRRPAGRGRQPQRHGLVRPGRQRRLRPGPAPGHGRRGHGRTRLDPAAGAAGAGRRRAEPDRPARPGAAAAPGRYGTAGRRRRHGVLPEAVPGRGVPLGGVHRPEQLPVPVRRAAPGRRYGSRYGRAVRPLPGRRRRFRPRRTAGRALGPGDGLPLVVPALVAAVAGVVWVPGPALYLCVAPDLRRTVRAVLPPGDARPGLPALPGRHGRWSHPRSDRQRRGTGEPPHRPGRRRDLPCGRRWPRWS